MLCGSWAVLLGFFSNGHEEGGSQLIRVLCHSEDRAAVPTWFFLSGRHRLTSSLSKRTEVSGWHVQ